MPGLGRSAEVRFPQSPLTVAEAVLSGLRNRPGLESLQVDTGIAHIKREN